MACNCNKTSYECGGQPISSNCVLYQGPPIPPFDICTGDPITYVEQQIINKINELLEAEETALENFDLQSCPELITLLGSKDVTYANLIQVLWTNQCTLRQLIKDLEDKLPNPGNAYPFNVKCTTPVTIGSNPVDINAIVQGVINKVCDLETKVDDLAPNIEQIIRDVVGEVLGSMITSLGNWGIQKTGTGGDTKYNFLALAPPYSALAYIGPASNFDASGKGLVGTPYEGWLLLVGGTVPDARGRALVAAVNSVPGGALDPAVDPSRPENPGTNYNSGDRFGENFHKLTIAELPTVTPQVIDAGHSHGYLKPTLLANADRGGAPDYVAATGDQTDPATTGITIAPFGGNAIHENRQPSLVITGWIVRLP